MQTNEPNDDQIRPLLRRIQALMERYFDAIENSLAKHDYPFSHREQDARVFNALAHTLTRLAKLDQAIGADEKETDNDDIQTRLEERISTLLKSPPAPRVSEQSQ